MKKRSLGELLRVVQQRGMILKVQEQIGGVLALNLYNARGNRGTIRQLNVEPITAASFCEELSAAVEVVEDLDVELDRLLAAKQ